MAAYFHFLVTGSYRYISWYFWIFGTLFFLLTTAAESFLAFECRAGFEADEPMRMAWTFIALAALARFAGTVLIALDNRQIASILGSAASLLAMALPRGLGQAGAVAGGPLSMVFLSIALSRVLQVQHRFGVLRGLATTDLLLIGGIVAFTLGQIVYIVSYLGPSYPSPPLAKVILWPSVPLLALLLIQAVLIRRSAIRVGLGLVSRCWEMYVMAIVITVAGNALTWAVNEGLIWAPFTELTWYIWFLAAAAFASAPAYQLAAMTLPLADDSAMRRRSPGQ